MNYTVLPFDLSACGSCKQCEVCYVALMVLDHRWYSNELFEQAFEHALSVASQRCNLPKMLTIRATLPIFTDAYSEKVVTIQTSLQDAFVQVYPLAETHEWRESLCSTYILLKLSGKAKDHECSGQCGNLVEESEWCWKTLTRVRTGLEQVEKNNHIDLKEE